VSASPTSHPAAAKRKADKRSRKRPAWGKILLITLILAALGAAWRYTPLAEFLTLERINRFARVVRETRWAPIVLVIAYTPAAVLMFPRVLLTLLAIVAFGLWAGIGYAAAGILLAAICLYYAGRVMRYDVVRRLAGDKLEPVRRVLRNHGIMAIFALNMVPAPPFAVQGAIAGACRVPIWHYVLGSILGMAPGLLAWTAFGGQIVRAMRDPSEIHWWVVAVVIALFSFFTWLVRRWFARHSAEHG
jgi:phospholipase D1/2